jgi:hypothetical protein
VSGIILSEKGNILLISNQLIPAMGRSASTEQIAAYKSKDGSSNKASQ